MSYSAVYERQCVLLKSLISLTRTLPAYQAARNRYDDKFDIKYDIYKRDPGKPFFSWLGVNFFHIIFRSSRSP